jgi:hypothetical protein
MDLLAMYFEKYEKLNATLCSAQAKLELERIRDLYTTVKRQHDSHRPKKYRILPVPRAAVLAATWWSSDVLQEREGPYWDGSDSGRVQHPTNQPSSR